MTRITGIAIALIWAAGATAQPFAPYGGYGGYGDPSRDFPYYRGVYPNPYAGPYSGRVFGAPARTCQKLCLQDTTPCDPPEYKRADGRCTNPTGGRF